MSGITLAARRRTRQAEPSVLYDVPGPKARLRNNIATLAALIVVLLIALVVIGKLQSRGQLAWKLWKPFLQGDVWVNEILPGLEGTLKASALAAVLALIFGVVFGIGRVSDHRWIRVPAGAVVEFFRAIPLLIMIFFAQAGPPAIMNSLNRTIAPVSAFTALVVGLTLYNGSVLAEIFRAGIRAVPSGQSEAGYAIGLRKSGVMVRVLLPQAVTAMMPAVVSQLVVLNKDTALGYIVAYDDLLNAGVRTVSANFGNLIPAAIVIAAIYIAINMTIGYTATWLERRSRSSRKTAAIPLAAGTGAPPAVGVGL